jgi:hypothetical protein
MLLVTISNTCSFRKIDGQYIVCPALKKIKKTKAYRPEMAIHMHRLILKS